MQKINLKNILNIILICYCFFAFPEEIDIFNEAANFWSETSQPLTNAKLRCQMERLDLLPDQRPDNYFDSVANSYDVSCNNFPSNYRNYFDRWKRLFCSNPRQFCENFRCLSEEERTTQFVNKFCEPGGGAFYTYENAKELPRYPYEKAKQFHSAYTDLIAAPSKVDEANRYFEIARDSMARYLRNLNPPAPNSVIQNVLNTELANYNDPIEKEQIKLFCSNITSNPTLSTTENSSQNATRSQREINEQITQQTANSFGRVERERLRTIVLQRAQKRGQTLTREQINRQIRLIQGQEAHAEWSRLQELQNLSPEEVPQLAIGVPNAVNIPKIAPLLGRFSNNKVILCPQMLEDAMNSNPRSLLTIFLHELGHTLDPCVEGTGQFFQEMMGFVFTGDCDMDQLNGIEEVEGRSFMARTQSLSQCLYHNSQMSNPPNLISCNQSNPRGSIRQIAFYTGGPGDNYNHSQRTGKINSTFIPGQQVKPGSRESMLNLVNTLLDAEISDENSSDTERLLCINKLKQFSDDGNGLLATCNPSFIDLYSILQAFTVNEEDIPADKYRRIQTNLHRFVRSSAQMEMGAETMADQIASRVLPLTFNNPRYQELAGHPTEKDKDAEILTMLSGFCEFPYQPGDSHPHPDFRISVFGGSQGLRDELGCDDTQISRVSSNGNFPSARCGL